MTPAAALDLPTQTDPRLKPQIDLAVQAQNFVVTRETKVAAERLILDLNAAERAVRGVLDPIVEAAHRTHKIATSKRAELLQPIENARIYLRRQCADIQRVLDDEARAEARRRSDELARQERERLAREAEQMADAGDVEGAMDVLEQVDQVAPVPASTVQVAVEKAEGITYRDNWTYCFIDAKGRDSETPDLSLIPVDYHVVDTKALGRVVGAMKERANIAGIRAFNDRKPVQTGGRG
jgi:hypothetical protein